MRLSDFEVRAIKQTAAKWFGPACVVRVFGSRVNDSAKGGDIDLHVIAETSELATLQAELGFAVDIQDQIGEQRIDLIVRKPSAVDRPIDIIAKKTGVLL